MVDTSGSQNRVLDQEKIVAGSFLEQVLTPGDRALIVTFDSDIELRHDFSNSAAELRAALDKVRRVSSKNSPELGAIGYPNRRSTALYDAIHLTAKNRFAGRMGRKVFILITDGEDRGSATEPATAIEEAIRADAQCYVLLVADSMVSGSAKYAGAKLMAELAERTGGRLIRVGRKLSELPRHFEEISTELRSQYSIGYTPDVLRSFGEYRTIEVRSRRGYRVQSRQGYFARFGKSRE
jgi:Ca-activated chloride channel family protein